MSDPKLRRSLTQRWAERLAPWLVVPDDVAPDERTRLLAARLLADGGWLAEAANVRSRSAGPNVSRPGSSCRMTSPRTNAPGCSPPASWPTAGGWPKPPTSPLLPPATWRSSAPSPTTS